MKRNNWIITITIVLISFVLFSQAVHADVITVKSAASDKDMIYVAGNPDYYPIEYYDEFDVAYKGVMPLLLERISEYMGVDFAYVSAGKNDKRMRLTTNGQVELVSAIIKDRDKINDSSVIYSSVPLRYEMDDGVYEVCFGFTAIATEEFKKSFEEALASMPENEIFQIAFGQSISEQPIGISLRLFIYALGIAFLILVILIVTILKLRQKQKSLKYAKWLDEVTGLGNKAYFIHNVNKVIVDVARPVYAIACIGFDIEKVNNYYSYDEAEDQLHFTAKELKSLEKKGDIVARIGGGRFVIAHVFQTRKVEVWISQVLDSLNRYCDKFYPNYRPEYHAGVYLLKKTDNNGELVIENAQIGYEYAITNSISYMITKDDFLRKMHEDKQLIEHITSAMKIGEILVYVQLVKNAKGDVIGGEVLSRWQHPTRGLLLPGAFIPILEKEGTITELDYYIFEQTCSLLEKWNKNVYKYTLSCNFNRTSISNDQFINRVEKIISKYDFNYGNLIIEITENTMNVNKEMAFLNMSRCKELGFQIGLDDVGSGYTSFSDLKEFPADIIKVDKSIVAGAINTKGTALLKGIITLAHNLGMLVQCEGIETEDQFLLLQSLKCDFYQGYYFYRQMPVEEVEKIIF